VTKQLDRLLASIRATHIPEPDQPTWALSATCRHCGFRIVRKRVGRTGYVWDHAKPLGHDAQDTKAST
jgi:DNA-directed RNA polymerase subunit RPC12/RpoP